MTPPAVVPAVPPAATSVRAVPAPAAAPRAEAAAPERFDRQLQAARQAQPGDPPAQRADARGPDPRPAAAAPPANAAALPTDPSPVVAAAAPATRVAPAAPPPAQPEVSEVPDEQAAAALAGALLALLGPATGALHPVAAAVDAAVAGEPTIAAGTGAVGLPMPNATVEATVAPAVPQALAGAATPLVAAERESQAPAATHDSAAGVAAAIAPPTLPVPAAPASPHPLQLASPPGSQAFAQDLGQQIAWLGGQEIKQARIRLHPEELGSLDVSVSVAAHGRVDVVFSAQHPAAVSAVQQSLPQLDHMLARHGLSLGHAEVGQHDRGQGRARGDAAGTGAPDDIGEIHAGAPLVLPGRVGLLDAFA